MIDIRSRSIGFQSCCTLRAAALLFFLAAVPSSYASADDTLRVEHVVADVTKQGDRLAAARYMEEAARTRIGVAGAWDDPMLMFGVQNLPPSFDFTMDPMTMKMVGLSQSIPLSGYKGLQNKASREEAQAASEDRQTMQLELVSAAQAAYADLYYRSQALRDMSAQYELLDQIVQTTRARLIVNQSSQEELLAAQAELWRMQSQLLMADHDVNEKWFQLQAMRGKPQDGNIPVLTEPRYDSIPASPDQWLGLAAQHYPALKKLSSQSRQYELESRAAARTRWPMLNVQGSYGIRSGTDAMTGDKRDNMFSFQLGLSVPLFSARQQKKMAGSMSAMRRSSDYESSQLARDIEARIRTLHEIAIHSLQSVELYRARIIPADEDAFEGAMAGYAANRKTLTDVLSYALNIYRDRIAEKQLANQLAQARAELSTYITDPANFAGNVSIPKK